MSQHEPGVTELLRRASDDLAPDIDRLVSGAITRGRSRQRRTRIGTTVASLAVIGVVGGLAAVVPRLVPDAVDGDAVVATDGPSTARRRSSARIVRLRTAPGLTPSAAAVSATDTSSR